MAKLARAILACGVACALPSQLFAACWTRPAAAAAEVRGLETMLMVSALRCRLEGYDFLPDYNRFVRVNRAALVDANDRLRNHFDGGEGWRVALDEYDSYVTAIANEHGERGAYGCRELALITLDAIDAAGDPATLLRLSRAVGVELPSAGRMCEGQGNWAQSGRFGESAADDAWPVTPVAPAATVASAPRPEPRGPLAPADPALPTMVVADAPIAEPQPAPERIEPAVQMAAASVPSAAPAPRPAARTVVAPGPDGAAAVSGSGDLEIEVSEGPVVNGVRTRTYRIRMAD